MQPANQSAPAWLGVLDDPLRALLLWGIVLTGKPDPALLALIGLNAVELESIVSAYGKSIERLRELNLVCQLLDVEQLRKLSLARLTEMTISATTPQQLYHAARTAAKLPEWVLDPELAALEAEVRRAERGARLMESRARHAEAAARLQRSSSGSGGVTPPSTSGTGAVTVPASLLDDNMQNAPHLAFSPPQVKSPGSGDATAPASQLDAEMQTAPHLGFSPSQVKSAVAPPAVAELHSPAVAELHSPVVAEAAHPAQPKRKRRSQPAKPASKPQPSRQPQLSSTGSPR